MVMVKQKKAVKTTTSSTQRKQRKTWQKVNEERDTNMQDVGTAHDHYLLSFNKKETPKGSKVQSILGMNE